MRPHCGLQTFLKNSFSQRAFGVQPLDSNGLNGSRPSDFSHIKRTSGGDEECELYNRKRNSLKYKCIKSNLIMVTNKKGSLRERHCCTMFQV